MKLTLCEMLDTFLTIHERVQVWSTNTNCSCAEANSLEDVRSALEAAIDIDFQMLEYLGALLAELK